MKSILFIFLSLTITAEAAARQKDYPKSENETILIFTRHAEKEKTNDPNPSLNEAGQKRAEKLLTLLRKYESINAIYSTDYNRTKETAQPISEYFKKPISIYDPSKLDKFKDQLIIQHRSDTVLIVGHSNTTQFLINLIMGENRVEQIDENDYSNLYVIKFIEDKSPSLQHYIY